MCASDVDITGLFNKCDLNTSGYIERDELRVLMPHTRDEEIDQLFSILDSDGDGRISRAELAAGLHNLQIQHNHSGTLKAHGNHGTGLREDNSRLP